ncbi:MAG: 50S ribosomal protein L6 [Candidatus Pacebacteria bacterium]|nr:50S ribosomal protein L6 [Candidatus Paceibacterota bacterium]
MSRIGKLPISLPQGVKAELKGAEVLVEGPKGKLSQKFLKNQIKVEISNLEIKVLPLNEESKDGKAFWGLYRSLFNNLVIGVSEGFEKKLEINGVGYRGSVSGNKLVLNLGYSHPVEFILPEGIIGSIEGNVITVSGADKQLVGETAARIRKTRKPDVYKAKGIKYVDEVIIKKEGKTSAKGE